MSVYDVGRGMRFIVIFPLMLWAAFWIFGLFLECDEAESKRWKEQLASSVDVEITAHDDIACDQARRLSETTTDPPSPIDWKVESVNVGYYGTTITLVEASPVLHIQTPVKLEVSRTNWFFHEFASLQPGQVVQLFNLGLFDRGKPENPASYLAPRCPTSEYYQDKVRAGGY